MTADSTGARIVGPVVDMSGSPNAKLHPVSLAAVKIEDKFWAPRIETNREVTLAAQLRQCEETGRIDNFRIASGKQKGEFQGIFFNDSDVYKWLEAAAYSLGTHPDPQLDADVDSVIADIASAQQPNGYLNTYYMFEREKERFSNLKDMHEIYCAGHLIQAAVAHHRATGKRTLLNVACRLSDHLYDVFGPGKRAGACGHEEAEMALVELYRDTGEKRYLALAEAMIEARGKKPPVLGGSSYHQDHLPFAEQSEMVGHAVRQVYLNCGTADVVAETGNSGYLDALNALWKNFTEKRMYVTGGAGSRYEGEAFGADYELPNDRAYTETCAAIGSVMWQWRMLNITGEARYADLMETTLYNAVLPGLSLDGAHYFYQNPLADRGKHRRQEWFGCACCPPNIARMLASLPGYFYSTAPNCLYVHLYATGSATIGLPDGGTVTVEQKTNYPWDGEIDIAVSDVPDSLERIALRIPWWAEDTTLTVNDAAQDVELEAGSYAEVVILPGLTTRINLSLQMPVERVESHPYVIGNRGRIALRRGPLVYCIEQADHHDTDVWDIAIPADAEFIPEEMPYLLGGVTVLHGKGVAFDRTEWEGALYALYVPEGEAETRPVQITAIPYYAWANREAGPMQVWIPTV